ncbi:type II toxin-antitoxin system VapC family toxin [Candidatus Ferrigenium straubiae]|jgi:tRNA(fMet)-specific endonuclease VapC|uniref:type II toxin-antitoxin system VapC family toxin n=1 Tax=Candidatus Ferrigenium straubiae TaxID=2919506 RepID=UPI003F4AD00C
MLYLPDTNVWIHHLNNTSSIVKGRLAAHTPSQVVLCDVVKAELFYGAFKSARRDANLALLESLFPEFNSLPFDGKAARLSGEIRADLARKGTPIGPYDLQIAAIALANGCTLVSHNTREFSRIAGLKLEDWEVEK